MLVVRCDDDIFKQTVSAQSIKFYREVYDNVYNPVIVIGTNYFVLWNDYHITV